MIAQTVTSVRAQHHLSREEEGTGHERKLVPDQRAHVSVMPREALEYLALKKGEVVVDATAGAGGHSEAMLEAAPVTLLALDADPAAAEAVAARLKRFGSRARVINANFKHLGDVLAKEGVEEIHKALFDLGWNSTQLTSGRGFSFLADEPLTMSYGTMPASGFTAAEIVNTWEESVIADVLFGYGEERYARKIARAIVARRERAPLHTTHELLEVIKSATPASYHHGRLHFATRTFQALRIATNDELGAIDQGLRSAWALLAKGGRIAVITFHSIEDRAVKRLFAEFVKDGGALLVKKPLTPKRDEVLQNRAARSAKMRVIEKTI